MFNSQYHLSHQYDETKSQQLMNQQTEITDLRSEHLQQSADVLTRSFLNLNDIWKKYHPSYQQIYPIMRAKILPALQSGWSYVLLKDKKVIGVTLQYELMDYLALPSMPSNLQLFSKLGKAGKVLENKLDLKGLKRGDAIYGLFGVIDPNEAKGGYSIKFWWHLFNIGKLAGWKYYYSRISSPVSLRMLKQLGAQVLGEVSVEEDQQKLWMIRIDLSNPLPTYKMLMAMSQNKRPVKANL